MSIVKTAEKTTKEWLKPVPHLPQEARKWLGENVWWIAGIGAAISAVFALMGLYGFFRAQSVLSAYGSVFEGYAYGLGTAHSLNWILAVLLPVVFTIFTAILLARAVKPLQNKQKAGWNTLFLLVLIEAIYVVLNAIFTFDVIGFIFTLIFGAIGLAVSAYLILEIEGEFEHQEKKTKKTVKK